MINRFKDEVLADYRNKIANGKLSDDMINPTRDRLKNACQKRCSDNIQLSDLDKEILKEFLGLVNDVDDYGEEIKKDEDAGRFRPLDKFLKGEVKNTHLRNLNLLAFLIDFPNRPYKIWQQTLPRSHPQKSLVQKLINISKSYRASILVISIAIAATSLALLTHTKRCMYWNVDHYEQAACEIKVNVPVIEFNQGRMDSLKMVTMPDTITYASIGKLWWGKTNGIVHFYTAGGDHPTDPGKRLLPISKYMINKYVPRNKTK